MRGASAASVARANSSGTAVEVRGAFRLSDNMVIDNRSEPKHIRGWAMFDSTGVESGSMVKGFLREAGNGKLPAPKNWNK